MKSALLASVLLVMTVEVSCSDTGNREPHAGTASATALPSDTAGRQSDPIAQAEAAPDQYGAWQRWTVEGVTFDLPADPRWRIDLVGDTCSDKLERFILMEDQTNGDRVQVRFARAAVVAETGGTESHLNALTSRIQNSFSGERALEERVTQMFPFPTSVACDPKAENEVPTLEPLKTPPPGTTVVVESTITPVTPPVPPPPPETP